MFLTKISCGTERISKIHLKIDLTTGLNRAPTEKTSVNTDITGVATEISAHTNTAQYSNKLFQAVQQGNEHRAIQAVLYQ